MHYFVLDACIQIMAIGISELAKLGNITVPSISKSNSDNSIFDDIYKSAIDMFNETNQLQKSADQMSTDFALGKIDNVHDVMVAQEKASVALQYTVRMRDAVVDAYNEIMRMQI